MFFDKKTLPRVLASGLALSVLATSTVSHASVSQWMTQWLATASPYVGKKLTPVSIDDLSNREISGKDYTLAKFKTHATPRQIVGLALLLRAAQAHDQYRPSTPITHEELLTSLHALDDAVANKLHVDGNGVPMHSGSDYVETLGQGMQNFGHAIQFVTDHLTLFAGSAAPAAKIITKYSIDQAADVIIRDGQLIEKHSSKIAEGLGVMGDGFGARSPQDFINDYYEQISPRLENLLSSVDLAIQSHSQFQSEFRAALQMLKITGGRDSLLGTQEFFPSLEEAAQADPTFKSQLELAQLAKSQKEIRDRLKSGFSQLSRIVTQEVQKVATLSSQKEKAQLQDREIRDTIDLSAKAIVMLSQIALQPEAARKVQASTMHLKDIASNVYTVQKAISGITHASEEVTSLSKFVTGLGGAVATGQIIQALFGLASLSSVFGSEQNGVVKQIESLADQIRSLQEYVSDRFDRLDSRLSEVLEKLRGIEIKIDRIAARQGKIQEDLRLVQQKLDELSLSVWEIPGEVSINTTALLTAHCQPDVADLGAWRTCFKQLDIAISQFKNPRAEPSSTTATQTPSEGTDTYNRKTFLVRNGLTELLRFKSWRALVTMILETNERFIQMASINPHIQSSALFPATLRSMRDLLAGLRAHQLTTEHAVRSLVASYSGNQFVWNHAILDRIALYQQQLQSALHQIEQHAVPFVLNEIGAKNRNAFSLLSDTLFDPDNMDDTPIATTGWFYRTSFFQDWARDGFSKNRQFGRDQLWSSSAEANDLATRDPFLAETLHFPGMPAPHFEEEQNESNLAGDLPILKGLIPPEYLYAQSLGLGHLQVFYRVMGVRLDHDMPYGFGNRGWSDSPSHMQIAARWVDAKHPDPGHRDFASPSGWNVIAPSMCKIELPVTLNRLRLNSHTYRLWFEALNHGLEKRITMNNRAHERTDYNYITTHLASAPTSEEQGVLNASILQGCRPTPWRDQLELNQTLLDARERLIERSITIAILGPSGTGQLGLSHSLSDAMEQLSVAANDLELSLETGASATFATDPELQRQIKSWLGLLTPAKLAQMIQRINRLEQQGNKNEADEVRHQLVTALLNSNQRATDFGTYVKNEYLDHVSNDRPVEFERIEQELDAQMSDLNALSARSN